MQALNRTSPNMRTLWGTEHRENSLMQYRTGQSIGVLPLLLTALRLFAVGQNDRDLRFWLDENRSRGHVKCAKTKQFQSDWLSRCPVSR